MPAFCEFWGIPYTGSDPLTLAICLDKGRAKEILAYHGIPTPSSRSPRRGALDGIPPLPGGRQAGPRGSSKGDHPGVALPDSAEVGRALGLVLARYRQPALIERWLPRPGVHVRDPGQRPGPPPSCPRRGRLRRAAAGAAPLYSYEAKWIWDTPERPLEIFQCPASVSRGLARRSSGRCWPPTASCAAATGLASTSGAMPRGTARPRGQPPCRACCPIPTMNSCFPKAARAAGLDYMGP